MKIAIVISDFNKEITSKMLLLAEKTLLSAGLNKKQINIFHVPGSFEIPVILQKLIDAKKYKGMLALGCVIKGKTDHYEYVCRGISYGIQKLSVKNRLPIIFGVLMCKTYLQAKVRIKKARYFAESLLKMLDGPLFSKRSQKRVAS